jgi:methylmalonyl-CoA mutase
MGVGIGLTSKSLLNKLRNMNTKQLEKKINRFVQQEGRRPRILLIHLESDQTNHWTRPLAASLAEFGFDIDIGPAHQTPLQAARLAIDNDAHVVCVSIAEPDNQPLIVGLAAALKELGGSGIRLAGGGAGLDSNHDELYDAGVDLIVDFDPADIRLAGRILDLLHETHDKSGSKDA